MLERLPVLVTQDFDVGLGLAFQDLVGFVASAGVDVETGQGVGDLVRFFICGPLKVPEAIEDFDQHPFFVLRGDFVASDPHDLPHSKKICPGHAVE